MCGQLGDGADAACSIRQQNKDVCTRCDTAIWIHVASQQHFKWCKGCKRFHEIHAFAGKLKASKCDDSRARGRAGYMRRKEDGENAS